MSGSNVVLVYKNGAITTLTNGQTTNVDKDQWCRCTYKHHYRSGHNYWIIHQYNSNT